MISNCCVVYLIELIGKCLIRFNNKWRMRWDLYVMLLAIWNCISIPFEVAFEPDETVIYSIIERIIDICFVIDIVLAFRTTFMNEKTGFEVIEANKIAKHYACSNQFLVDLLASIPFDDLYLLVVGKGAASN